MKLGERLACAAKLVKPGTFIDIGSDHGYLPVYLIKNGICVTAAASDINKAPLERAKATAERYGVADKMEFFLSDGFESISKTYDTACICGMGGQVITDIIERGKGKFNRLIIQPMTKAELVRQYLWENGYLIENELYPSESGKPYAVISAYHDDVFAKYKYNDMFLGRVRPNTDGYRLYAEKVLTAAKKRYGGTKRFDDASLAEECLKIIETPNRTF